MTQGVLLISFGHPSYGKWAYNLAHSIKHFSPDLLIHLAAEEEAVKGVDLSIFDSIEYHLFDRLTNGRHDVGQIKTTINQYSPFNKTLYLDCDGVALKDISPLFDFKDTYFQALSAGKYTDNLNYTWADKETIWSHFGLSEDTVYPSIQSSIVGFTKKSKPFFDKLQKNYARPVPDESLLYTWGKTKAQPDELYYSATLAQLGIVPDMSQPVYFPTQHTNKLGEIIDNHYLMAMHGAGLVRPFAKDFYDRLMHSYMRGYGRPHYYKAAHLYKDKFSSKK